MKTSDFDYELPPEQVAQFPLADRDQCRLLCLDKTTGEVQDKTFRDLLTLLKPGDRLVFNNTRVLPARVFCKKKTGAAVELLFTQPLANGSWKTLVHPGRRLKPGTSVHAIADKNVVFEIKSIDTDGSREVSLDSTVCNENVLDVINRLGVMALPHYIKRSVTRDDVEAYQTVFAEKEGAIAAPTAGLHFTVDLIDLLKNKGIDVSYVTLHVGIGTFRPVSAEDPTHHHMHVERYDLSAETVAQINKTKAEGGRVVAVGTTVVRVLEHCATQTGLLCASSGETDLLILPGFSYKVIDGMITNFHVPRSTLLMLVSAFAGRDAVLAAYNHAVAAGYRFFSYGDAMLIV